MKIMKLCKSISLLRKQNDPPISNNASITMHALKKSLGLGNPWPLFSGDYILIEALSILILCYKKIPKV